MTDVRTPPPPFDLDARVGQLSPRQRECLRLSFHRRTSKEIANQLGLAEGTVKTYCTEAIRTLAARDRRHAAETLHIWESAHGASGSTAPSEGEPPSGGVSSAPQSLPAPVPAVPSWARLLPFRHKDASGNDLPVLARLFWIVAFALAIAVGFGALASGLHVVSDLLRGRG